MALYRGQPKVTMGPPESGAQTYLTFSPTKSSKCPFEPGKFFSKKVPQTIQASVLIPLPPIWAMPKYSCVNLNGASLTFDKYKATDKDKVTKRLKVMHHPFFTFAPFIPYKSFENFGVPRISRSDMPIALGLVDCPLSLNLPAMLCLDFWGCRICSADTFSIFMKWEFWHQNISAIGVDLFFWKVFRSGCCVPP